MSQESQHVGISAKRNVFYRSDTNNPINNALTKEQETIQLKKQPTMSTPVITQVVNPHNNNVDLSAPEGKKLCQNITGILPAA